MKNQPLLNEARKERILMKQWPNLVLMLSSANLEENQLKKQQKTKLTQWKLQKLLANQV
jgi:hypothetical protein